MLKLIKILICFVILFSFSGISFAQDESDQVQDLYLAKKAFEDGFYEIALKHFQDYLKVDTQDQEEVQIFISRCYLKLGNFTKALRGLEEILKQSIKEEAFREATYWTAQTYFEAKDYKSALEFFQKIIDEHPDSVYLAKSYYYRASCHYQLSQFDQALELYRKFNKKFPKDVLRERSLFHMAQCLYNMKDYSNARDEFKAFIKHFSESNYVAWAFYYLAEIEYILTDFNKAVQYCQRAQEAQPKSRIAALARYSCGWAYLKLGDHSKALNEFEALSQDAEFAKALEDSIAFARGRTQVELKNYKQAIGMYDEIISGFPHSSWFDDAYFWKGQALYELGNYTQAAELYKEAIEKFSLSETKEQEQKQKEAVHEREDLSLNLIDNLRYNLGWTYARMKKYPQAIEQFNQVLADSEERFLKSGVLVRIGDIYFEQEKIQEAIANYDTVLRDYPDSYYADYAQYQLGLCLFKEEDFTGAILAFNTLIANFPQSNLLDKARYQIGLIYFRQGQFLAARESLQELIKVSPKSSLKAQAIFLRACAYYNEKQYLEAQEAFGDVLGLSSAEAQLRMKAQYQQILCLYQMGRQEKTAAGFEKFLTKYPDSTLTSEVFFWLGQLYYRQQKYPLAHENFIQLLKRFPQSELTDEGIFWQAKVYSAEGKSTLALDKLQRLKDVYPNSDVRAEALLLQASILEELNRIDEADKLYKLLLIEFEGSGISHLTHQKRAQIMQGKEEFAQAIEEYAKALGSESANFNAQIQFSIAECWQQQGNLSQALDNYLKVTYLYPDAIVWARKAQFECAQIIEEQGELNRAINIYKKLAEEDSQEGKLSQKRLKELIKQ